MKSFTDKETLRLDLNNSLSPCLPLSLSLKRHRSASVLLLALIVIALLTLGAMSFFERMSVEHQAVRAHIRQLQSRYLAESGIEYAKTVVTQDADTIAQAGGLYDNASLFQGKLVADSDLAAFRGRFTTIAPQIGNDGYYAGVRYGLENESARLNLNTILLADNYGENGARNLLMALPGMTEPIADAILDWIDPDNEQRPFGAEQDYYSTLNPPYEPRNGPLGSIEELLLVRDVTPELLFGADLNRNALIEKNEEPLTAMQGVDNSNGALNRGWSAYLTIDSAEKNVKADGTPKININMSNLQELHDQAAPLIGEEMAAFICAYRQGGPYTGTDAASSASSVTMDYSQPGRVSLQSLLDLVGAKTRVVPKGQAQAQSQGQSQGGGQAQGGGQSQGQGAQDTRKVIDAAFKNDVSSMRDYLPKLFENFSVNPATSIPGRININQAPKPIIMGIPGLDPNAAEQIISSRQPEPDTSKPDHSYETWLLTDGIVTLEQMKKLMPLVTASGSVYRAQIVGYFDEEGPAFRTEVVIDATKSPPVVKRRRDLVDQGPGYTADVLGTQPDDLH